MGPMPASWPATGADWTPSCCRPTTLPCWVTADEAAANKAVAGIKEPLPRLVAAALLLKTGRADPATLALAVDTASERGWRRPLLAWLEVELKRARDAGDSAAAGRIQRRIDLVMASGGKPAP
jgi:hypothetical protein